MTSKPPKRSPKSPKSPNSNSAMSSDYHPLSSCGPLDNQFLDFYSELFYSAVMFSNPLFQQRLLFSSGLKVKPPSVPSPLISTISTLSTQKQRTPSPLIKRSVKRAQRRLSSNSNGNNEDQSLRHRNSSDYSTDILAINKQELDKMATATATSMTTTKKIRRKVSFSKNSPRSRSNSNTKGQFSPNLMSSTPINWRKALPRITIQENSPGAWSSDMDETDTTETETFDQSGIHSSTVEEEDDNEDLFVPKVLAIDNRDSVEDAELQVKFDELSTFNGDEEQKESNA